MHGPVREIVPSILVPPLPFPSLTDNIEKPTFSEMQKLPITDITLTKSHRWCGLPLWPSVMKKNISVLCNRGADT